MRGQDTRHKYYDVVDATQTSVFLVVFRTSTPRPKSQFQKLAASLATRFDVFLSLQAAQCTLSILRTQGLHQFASPLDVAQLMSQVAL
eukprot:1752952-Amphidinium_carterae.2